MSAMKIKKGDTVKVIAGKDKGKEGKVLAVNVKDNTVIVERYQHGYKAQQTISSKPGWRNHNKRSCSSRFQRNARCRRKSNKSWIPDGWRQKSTCC